MHTTTFLPLHYSLGMNLALGRGGTHIGGTSGARFALVRAFVPFTLSGTSNPATAA